MKPLIDHAKSRRTKMRGRSKRYRYRSGILTTTAALLLQGRHMSSCTASAASNPPPPQSQITSTSQRLPQHRVRATKRMLQYGPEHPWHHLISAEDESLVTKSASSTVIGSTSEGHGPTVANDVENNGDQIAQESGEGDDHDSGHRRSRRIETGSQSSESGTPKSPHVSFAPFTDSGSGSDTTTTSAQASYEPMRIRAELVSDESSGHAFLSVDDRATLLEEILNPALDHWSQALSVIPISGNLVIDQDQLYDSKSCGPGIASGLPSVVVPTDHMDHNAGIEDTDLMIYLSIGFQGDLLDEIRRDPEKYLDAIHHRRNLSVDVDDDDDDDDDDDGANAGTGSKNAWDKWILEEEDYSTAHSIFFPQLRGNANNSSAAQTRGQGDSPSGTIKSRIRPRLTYTLSRSSSTGTSSSKPNEPSNGPSSLSDSAIHVPACSGAYLASSTYCATDEFDRPIAGILHLCIDANFFNRNEFPTHQTIIMHEIGHILGFNAQSLAHFRNFYTGEPLTKRDTNKDVYDQEVICTGIVGQRGKALIPLPSEETLTFREARGGIRVAQVVTPTVRQIVRNHFDCNSLEGAELETYPHQRDSKSNAKDVAFDDAYVDHCISDHWERRLFKFDIMNPIMDSVASTPYISPLTLAFFIDSGWYKVDVSRAAEPDSWGRAAGCDFVDQPCISEGLVRSENSQFFCNDVASKAEVTGCSDDMMGKAYCSMVEYATLPSEYKYFQNNIGGHDADLDYCPSFVGLEDRLCAIEDKTKERIEEFGASSRCLTGRVGKSKSAALCAPIACNVEDKTLQVRVDGQWKPCMRKGAIIESWYTHKDHITCPDPVRTCPSFYCPKNCLFERSAGICDYNTGNCDCPYDGDEDEANRGCDHESTFNFDTSLSSVYVLDASSLVDDSKNIIDHTERMFIRMNAGEMFAFVTASLLAVGTCFVLGTIIHKLVTQSGRSYRQLIPKLWNRDWRTDIVRDQLELVRMEGAGNGDKDKMVASVLHNMRVEAATNESAPVTDDRDDVQENIRREQSESNNEHDDDQLSRIFYRSELPPLPGVGRVVSVVGSRFVNDSIVPNDVDDTMTLAGTADTRTSGVGDLNSDLCTEGHAQDLTLDEDYSVPCSQPRRRVITQLF